MAQRGCSMDERYDPLFPEDDGTVEETVQPVSDEVLTRMDAATEAAGGPYRPHPEEEGCIGWTMFDTPQARDGTVVGLLPKEQVGRVPNRALVRIRSVQDGRSYLGIIQEGPFAEPDGLRADAPVVVTTTVRGRIFMPRYHGRLHVELMGEEKAGGLVPPRFRPFPNSPVFLLDVAETARVLRCGGELVLGQALGHEGLEVGIPATRKGVLPRHTGVLGTTGSGKSTTVSRLIHQAQKAGSAVVLLDVEGEYTEMGAPTDDPKMVEALRARGQAPEGVPNTHLYHLVGCDTTNPRHPARTEFSLPFSRLSPYAVIEVLDLSEAQAHRYWQAYDVAKQLLRDLKVYPASREEEAEALALNEFDAGYPRLTLSILLDVANACHHVANKNQGDPQPYNDLLRANVERLKQAVRAAQPDHAVSWRALLARLWQLHRLGVFDRGGQGRQGAPASQRDLWGGTAPRGTAPGEPIAYAELVQPGRVSIVDLSDTESPDLKNLVIADILRGVQEAQEAAYTEAVRRGQPLPRTLVVVEEAHEFLSEERIDRMPHLFQQVARIAKRGRKRWLGLVFVTQHPQHLPSQLFGLINSYVLHRINDAAVIARLRRSIGGVDEGLWERLPALAPGQAVATFTHMARPLLVAVDPTPCKLRMAEE